MATLADSEGLMASLFEASKYYEVHAAKGGTQNYLLACTSRSPDKVEWVAPFDTREHFPWSITVTRDEGTTNIRVTIHGEHWKGGTQQMFTFLFDRSTGSPR